MTFTSYITFIKKAEDLIKLKNYRREILIVETFILWYHLIEGIKLNGYSESELNNNVKRNYTLLKNEDTDPEILFLLGWMLNISPWYFGENDEEKGKRMLSKAYKLETSNILFKWAVRNNLQIHEQEKIKLEESLKENFPLKLDYDSFIKNYFLDLWK